MLLEGLLAPLPMVIAMAALLLGGAGLLGGVWSWPSALGFLGLFWALSTAGSVRLALTRPASFRVRRKGAPAGADQPLTDRVGLAVYAACMAAWMVFIPLDVFRLRLLAPVGPGAGLAGLALAMAGVVVVNVAVGQNQFASPTIHDQRGSGQRIVDQGLYGIVRHPFYAGMLMVYAGMALWLGSYAALIGASAFLLMTLARIAMEESFLRQRFPEYADYARRVRGRLIPYLL